MYYHISIEKLSENQLSRLRNGHPVRVKICTKHSIYLTIYQIKKLEAAQKKNKESTIQFDPYQTEAHGSGMFGDIARKAKAFVQKHTRCSKSCYCQSKTIRSSCCQSCFSFCSQSIKQITTNRRTWNNE